MCSKIYDENMKTASGGLRQPVFKGLMNDKAPQECIIN